MIFGALSSLFRPQKPNGHAALHIVEAAAAPSPAPIAVPSELATTLSPSQVKTFTDCSAKWWYKYGLDMPDRKTAALALGTAIHTAVEANYRQKIETKEDLPVSGVQAVFRDEWQVQADEAVFTAKDDPNDLRELGEAMTAEYMEKVAPRIQPAAVEVQVRGEIAGVRVGGWIDLIDQEGTIIDTKTARSKPSGISPDYRFQVATYASLYGGASGRVRLDTLTKTKTIQLIEQSFAIEQSDLIQIQRMYPLAQEAMRSGLYTPNRMSNLCSRKHCPFWEACEDDFGGRVDES